MEITPPVAPASADRKLRVIRRLADRGPILDMILGICSLSKDEQFELRAPTDCSMSIVDTARQNLPRVLSNMQSRIIRKELVAAHPPAGEGQLYPVREIGLYGNAARPFVGITFGGMASVDEREAIAKKLSVLDPDYIDPPFEYIPHMSLVQTRNREVALEIKTRIENFVPSTLLLHSIDVEFRSWLTPVT